MYFPLGGAKRRRTLNVMLTFAASGLAPDALARGRPVLDLMRGEVMAGQYLDLMAQASGDGSVASALRVVEYKTARYTIERPLHLGAALAGPGGSAITAAYTGYGRPLGVAFQLRDDILGMLKDHRIDIAIGGHPPAEADVEAEAFARHPHCIVSAPGHALAAVRGISWSDLRDEPFIFRESTSATRHFLEHLLQSQSLQVNVTMELAGNETVKQAVMDGMGISFMSAHAVQVELAARRAVVGSVTGADHLAVESGGDDGGSGLVVAQLVRVWVEQHLVGVEAVAVGVDVADEARR